MKAMKWIGPSILVAALIATQAFRIVGVAQTDPEAAMRDVGIGVGVLATFAVVVAGIFWARSGDRAKRRRALGSVWIDDVTVSPLAVLRESEAGVEMPRDFALTIDDGAVKLWATVGGRPVLTIAGPSIRSVELTEIPVSNYVEHSVAVLIANRISDLMAVDVRPALFE